MMNDSVSEPAGQPGAIAQIAHSDDIPAPSLLRVLWERRWIVAGTTVLSLVVALVYLLQATPVFESTSRLYVEKEGPAMIAENDGMVMTQSSNYLYTQVELIRAVPILSATVEALDVRSMRTFAGIDNPVAFLREICLDVSVGGKDEIISVAARSPYPQEAARIVNAVVDSYISYHARKKHTTAGQILEILQTEKNERVEELREKLEAIVEFKKQAGVLIFDSGERSFVVKRLELLWDALSSAQLEAIEARIARDALEKIDEDSALNTGFTNSELLSRVPPEHLGLRLQLRHDLHRAHETRRTLLEEYTGECPPVRAAQARIDALEKEIELEREALLAAAEQRYRTAKEKEQMLTEAIEKHHEMAAEAIVKQAEYAVLDSERKRAEKLCDILDERIKEINVTEHTGALNISILEVASAEDEPVAPERTRIMAAALALGLMLGAGLAFLRDGMDKRLRSTAEMTAAFGAPLLGVLPHMSGARTLSRTGQQVHLDPRSPVAEAYRSVRTTVYFDAASGEAKSLLVTSPAPGDGKTTVASNIAISMAQAGERTLILDADFRRPSQHKVFGLDGIGSDDGVHFPEVLAGDGRWEECIRPTGIDRLDILPCGSTPANPVEILSSADFERVLKELTERYDRVIIDSPPLLPVADARILGALCDFTLVVLRVDKATGRIVEFARDALESVGAHVLGIVANDVPLRKENYGYVGDYTYEESNSRSHEWRGSSKGVARRRRGDPGERMRRLSRN